MLGRHVRVAVALGLAWAVAGVAAHAQEPVQEGVIRVGEPKREVKAWAEEGPPPVDGVAVGPESELREMPGRNWRAVADLSDAELEAESAALKQERSVRVRAIGALQEDIAQLTRRAQKQSSEKERKKFEYQRALRMYRLTMEQREGQTINSRLQVLSRERARRRTPAETPTDPDLLAGANVRQVREAVALLGRYDAALAKVLRREPFTEADLIRALGLLEEKAPVGEMVSDYLRLLEERTAPPAAADAAPAAESAP